MKKLVLLSLLTVMIVFSLCVSVSAQPYNGECGDGVYWSLDMSTGHLSISGSGAMADYDNTPGAVIDAPWKVHERYIKSVSVDDGVTHIGDCAFYYMTHLNSVTLSESVKTIGDSAFCNCKNLQSITLHDGITEIGESAFSYCSHLNLDKLPSLLTKLGAYAFINCDSVTRLAIPEGVTTLAEGSFNACDLLSALLVSDSVINVERYLFLECPELTVFSDSAKVIEYCQSQGIPCKNKSQSPTDLQPLPKDENADDSGVCGGAAYWSYYESEEKLVVYGTGRTLDYEYSNSFDGEYTAPWYKYKDNIKIVEIKSGINGIGEFGFSELSKLNEVIVPEGLTYFGDYAFFNCNALQSIGLPLSFHTSYTYTFPLSLKEICGYEGSYAQKFAETNGYDFVPYDSYLYGGKLNDTLTWSLNTKIGKLIIDGSGDIPDYDYGTAPWYSYRMSITSAELSKDITGIGSKAFYECENLEELNIPDGVTWLGDACFSSCAKLKEIHLPQGIAIIPNSAFLGCRSVESIQLPDGVEHISRFAFTNCTSLKEIILPDTVEVIEGAAFAGTALTSFTVPPKVSKVKDTTFSKCYNLSYVTVHKDVTYIDDLAFYMINPAIRGYKGSYAETYAVSHDIAFVDLESRAGDINGDSVIELKDVTTLRRYLAEGYATAVADSALDVNGDGEVDLKDVTYLRRALAGGYGITLQ